VSRTWKWSIDWISKSVWQYDLHINTTSYTHHNFISFEPLDPNCSKPLNLVFKCYSYFPMKCIFNNFSILLRCVNIAVYCGVLWYVEVYCGVVYVAVWDVLRYITVCFGMLRFSGRTEFWMNWRWCLICINAENSRNDSNLNVFWADRFRDVQWSRNCLYTTVYLRETEVLKLTTCTADSLHAQIAIVPKVSISIRTTHYLVWYLAISMVSFAVFNSWVKLWNFVR
jgi:hypothetical protein